MTSFASAWRLFLSAWTDRRTQLLSSLAAEQCLQRLREDFGGLFGGAAESVRGRMFGRQARLTRRIFYQNSFRTVVSVSVTGASAGPAVVSASAGTSLPVRIFMGFWFGFILLWWGLAGSAVAGGGAGDAGWIFILAPIPMLAFGFALVAGCRYLARDDEAAVLAYLRRRLEAA